LRGSAGADTYIFNLGDGQDEIQEAGGVSYDTATDTLKFGEGIDPEDLIVTISPSGQDLIIQIDGTSDQVKIDYAINYEHWRVDEFEFADGTVLSYSEVLGMVIG
jgi:hypothetical protein